MLTRSVLDTKRADEWGGNVLQLVERWLHRDLYLHCGLRSLKRSNADVRARLCRCRGGIVERKRANVYTRYVPNAKRRTDEWQRAGDDGYEQARLRCDVHVQQRLFPVAGEPSHVCADRHHGFWNVEWFRTDVRCGSLRRVGVNRSRLHYVFVDILRVQH